MTAQCTGALCLGTDWEPRCNRTEPHTGDRTGKPYGWVNNAHWHKPTDGEDWFVEWYDDTPTAYRVEVDTAERFWPVTDWVMCFRGGHAQPRSASGHPDPNVAPGWTVPQCPGPHRSLLLGEDA